MLRTSPLALGALSALGLLLAHAPASAATLSDEAAAAFDIDNAFVEGLGDPTDAAELPDGRVLITQKTGDVAVKIPGTDDPVVTHIDVETGHNERGLLGVVADTDFATNHFVYFYASLGDDANNRQHVLRYTVGDDSKLTAQKVIIDMGLRGPANHNGGAIDMYQGNLYLGVGDTGANATPAQNHFGSCLDRANGKVLRVTVEGQPVADNPLMAETMVTGCDNTGGPFAMAAPEKRIYAWGFRNPFRLWVDKTTGLVWVGDVGEETREEISVVEKGKHYGYPFEEGTTVYNQNFKPANGCAGIKLGDKDGPACTPPVFDWARAGGGSSMGGRILDGCDWPAPWKTRYIFGDHEQGKAWTLDVNAQRNGVVANSLKQFATTSGITAMRMGTDNALYIVERGAGRVARVTVKGQMSMPGMCPAINGEPGNPGGGGAGGGGSGGNATGGASAGSGNPSGGNATAGSNSTSGSANNGAGMTGNPSGGSNGATGGGNSADSGGCGCRAVGGSAGSLLGLSALIGALGLGLGRRRRNRGR